MAQNLYFSEADLGKKRRIQEDSHFAAEPENPGSPISTILLVADGMGGHEAGEIASAIARDIIKDFFVKGKYKAFANKFGISLNKNPANYLEEILRETIFYIHSQIKSKAGSRSMGTTLTTALILKSNTGTKPVIIGHVGDSRAYILNENRVKQVTEDDSAVWKLYKSGKVSKDRLRTIKGNNVITQALGGESMDRPHIYKSMLKSNEVLLLSSDGLHGLISDKRILNIVRSSNNARNIADELIAVANRAGGKDNISVALYSERFKEKKKGSEHRTLNKILAVAASIVFLLGVAALLIFVIFDKPDKPGEDDEKIVIQMDEPKEVPPNEGDKFSVIINDKFDWDPGPNDLNFKIVDTTRNDFENYRIKLIIPGVKKNRDEYTIMDFGKRQLNYNNIGNGVKVIQELNFDDPGTRQCTLTVQRPGDDAIVVRKFTIITNEPPGRDTDSAEIIILNPDDREENNENIDDSTNITIDIPEEENKVEDTKIDTVELKEEMIQIILIPPGENGKVTFQITFFYEGSNQPFGIDGNFKIGNGKLLTKGKICKFHYIQYDNKDFVPPKIKLKIDNNNHKLRKYFRNELRTYFLINVKD